MSAGVGDSLVRNAVLAGVVLSPEPLTRWRLGQAVGLRFEDVFASWDPSHAYGHVQTLVRTRLVVPIGGSRPRLRASAAGVESWRGWLASPIDPRIPLRDALARLRSCRDRDYTTMLAVIDLCEEQLQRVLELPAPLSDGSLTAQLVRNAQRNRAAADLRWCFDARDEIAALAARSSSGSQ
jgi:hypothetical protein